MRVVKTEQTEAAIQFSLQSDSQVHNASTFRSDFGINGERNLMQSMSVSQNWMKKHVLIREEAENKDQRTIQRSWIQSGCK